MAQGVQKANWIMLVKRDGVRLRGLFLCRRRAPQQGQQGTQMQRGVVAAQTMQNSVLHAHARPRGQFGDGIYCVLRGVSLGAHKHRAGSAAPGDDAPYLVGGDIGGVGGCFEVGADGADVVPGDGHFGSGGAEPGDGDCGVAELEDGGGVFGDPNRADGGPDAWVVGFFAEGFECLLAFFVFCAEGVEDDGDCAERARAGVHDGGMGCVGGG